MKISVMQFLKDCIGKDLSRISLPVIMSMPVSILQKMAETQEYNYLIDKAVQEKDDPVKRMMYLCIY